MKVFYKISAAILYLCFDLNAYPYNDNSQNSSTNILINNFETNKNIDAQHQKLTIRDLFKNVLTYAKVSEIDKKLATYSQEINILAWLLRTIGIPQNVYSDNTLGIKKIFLPKVREKIQTILQKNRFMDLNIEDANYVAAACHMSENLANKDTFKNDTNKITWMLSWPGLPTLSPEDAKLPEMAQILKRLNLWEPSDIITHRWIITNDVKNNFSALAKVFSLSKEYTDLSNITNNDNGREIIKEILTNVREKITYRLSAQKGTN